MAVYRILLTGRNNMMIDDFFYRMEGKFKPVTTSLRYADMVYHVNNVVPDAFVICLNGESRDELARFSELKRHLQEINSRTIIIGSEDECEDFRKTVINMADLVITKPASADDIAKKITDFLQSGGKTPKAAEPEPVQSVGASAYGAAGKRKHVLVVDDDPMILKMIKEMLHHKYDVATAPNGKVARTFLSNKDTDLILLDYEMPLEDGPYVYRTIREMEKYRHTPILFLTGVTDREKINDALILKPQGYILKPIDNEKFMRTLEGFLG